MQINARPWCREEKKHTFSRVILRAKLDEVAIVHDDGLAGPYGDAVDKGAITGAQILDDNLAAGQGEAVRGEPQRGLEAGQHTRSFSALTKRAWLRERKQLLKRPFFSDG